MSTHGLIENTELRSRLLQQKGLLFVVLPKACIENSRYMNHDLFVKITEVRSPLIHAFYHLQLF